MTFKWNTKLPNISHKIKSEDFEVSNRIYRIVVACVTHIVPQIYFGSEQVTEKQNDHSEPPPTSNEIINFVCLCGKGCSKNHSTSRLYFIGIEYRGNSYTPIPTNISMKIEGDKTKRLTMVYSFSKYEDYYGEYFEIPCKQYSRNDKSTHDQLKMTISLIIQPYKQYLIGIRNLGATCYINSLLQTFFWNDDFFKKIMAIDCFSNNKILLDKDDNLLKKEEKIMYRNIKSLQSIFYLLTPAISQIEKLTDDLLEKGSESNIDSYTAGNTSNCQEIERLPYSTTFNPISHLEFSLLGPIHEHQDVHEWFKMLMDRVEGEMKEYCMQNSTSDESDKICEQKDDKICEQKDDKICEQKDDKISPPKDDKISPRKDEKNEPVICQDTPQSLNSSQNDKAAASEKVFDKISPENNSSTFTKDFFNEIFDGKMSHIIQSECGCVSRREQTFSEIEVDFFDCTYDCPYNPLALTQSNSQQTRFINNLQHSLEHYFSKEELIEPNQYFCETHQGHFNATKYIRIKKMSNNLIFIIKRFNMNWETMGVEKDDREMRFTENLDLTRYMDDYKSSDCSNERTEVISLQSDLNSESEVLNLTVSLNSVIVHQGIPTDGHYYSYARINHHFYKFNDNQVNQVSNSEMFLHQSGGRHPYKGITKDHSAYLLSYSVRNDLEDQSIYSIAQNQNSSEINRDYLINLYQKKADLFPKTLIGHFVSLSDKLACTDTYKMIGYDGPGAFNFSRRFPITRAVQMSMDELRAVGIHKKYHYIFSILSPPVNQANEANEEIYALSSEIRETTTRIFSFYTNNQFDWSNDTNLFFIKRFCDSLDYHKYCGVYPMAMIKTIGVDTQKESWAEGFDIFDEDDFSEKELGSKQNESTLGKNIILHKGQDEKVKNLLTFIHKRGIVKFKNGGFIVKLFLKEDDLWQDVLQKHLHSMSIRVANGRGFSEAYKKTDGQSENDHIDFFIPPNTALLSIGRGCLDYNKVSHFHTVLIERGLTVKQIVECLRMKRACVFKENVLEQINGHIAHNDDSGTKDQSEYVLIQMEKDSINVKIYRENDQFNGCKPQERLILQKIKPIWTDYVVFTYMKNEEFIGYPFLVYWNSNEVIDLFERTRSEVYNSNNPFSRNTQVVTWNMIKLKYNIIDKIYLIQNDMMRQMEGDEEVQTGSICVLMGN